MQKQTKIIYQRSENESCTKVNYQKPYNKYIQVYICTTKNRRSIIFFL